MSSLAKLLRLGASALKPTKQADGTWHMAEVSARAAARLRKQAQLAGMPWVYEEPAKRSRIFERICKGHKADRARPEREARVAAGLAKQAELLAARVKAREPKPGDWLDREMLTATERRMKARAAGSNS